MCICWNRIVLTWLAPQMHELYDRHLGPDWVRHSGEPQAWESIESVSDGELWETHQALKSRRIDFVRRRAATEARHRGESPEFVKLLERSLRPTAHADPQCALVSSPAPPSKPSLSINRSWPPAPKPASKTPTSRSAPTRLASASARPNWRNTNRSREVSQCLKQAAFVSRSETTTGSDCCSLVRQLGSVGRRAGPSQLIVCDLCLSCAEPAVYECAGATWSDDVGP